jgi:phenylalanyl-tRNA synthetase alpha subunit
MSLALYQSLGGLRFWTPEEVSMRNKIKATLVETVTTTLLDLNQMWRVVECETPTMMPVARMSAAYDASDIFILQDAPGGTDQWAMRAETTDGTYLMAKHLLSTTTIRPPLCIYQSGKSFRRETSDGATAAKLRFNEFHQLEFQCIFGTTTTAPIAETLRTVLLPVVSRITGRETRLVESDRLPSYSTETIDIEVLTNKGEWREIASTSRRTDFPKIDGMKFDCLCFEVAFGLDRLVALTLEQVE